MRTLALAVAAASLLLSAPAHAGNTSNCDWVEGGVLRCWGRAESERFIVDSLCASSSIDAKCATKTYEKIPGTDSSRQDIGGGVSVMRGGTPPKLRELNR
jgi:hypothetical protein